MKTLLVQPNLSYQLLGTNDKLHKDRTYRAIPATNQPDYKKKGLVFVYDHHLNGILLSRDEYKVVKLPRRKTRSFKARG